MKGNSDQQATGNPAVDPIKLLKAETRQNSNHIVFPYQKKEERQLTEINEAGPVADGFISGRIAAVQIVEAEDE